MQKNISLIGMPGAGKSTIGVLLAKSIGYPFLDTDLLIQSQENRLLHEIIEDSGINDFLKIEEKTLLNLNLSDHVIATGGSAVYSKNGMNRLKEIGTVIYLKQSYEEIEKRLGNIKTRGVVISKGKTLKNLFDERTILYEKYADIIVDCIGKDAETVIETIINMVKDSGI